MNSRSRMPISVIGKLPAGALEMYEIVALQASKLRIPFLVVGATARDIILYHGFGADIERGTRDIDFAIQLRTWQAFNQLKEALIKNGFAEAPKHQHKLTFISQKDEPWELDLLPFGDIADSDFDISWPPSGEIKMAVHGFAEALATAWEVDITNSTRILVASPAALIILKLVAWTERDPSLRIKDARDIGYTIKHYSRIPSVFEQLYSQGFMEEAEYDQDLAAASFLGNEIANMSSAETLAYLNKNIFLHPQKLTQLSLEMQLAESETWLEAISKALNYTTSS